MSCLGLTDCLIVCLCIYVRVYLGAAWPCVTWTLVCLVRKMISRPNLTICFVEVALTAQVPSHMSIPLAFISLLFCCVFLGVASSPAS